jgi:hypothetical protein
VYAQRKGEEAQSIKKKKKNLRAHHSEKKKNKNIIVHNQLILTKTKLGVSPSPSCHLHPQTKLKPTTPLSSNSRVRYSQSR